MQPCPNCGRTELTPAGNCQNCGLFRGSDPHPGYAQGYASPVDPYSAAPYSADPYSSPPYQGQQGYQRQSYQQGYQQPQPQYAAGYQNPNAYQAPPPPTGRRPSTVPLIVLSVIAVILVIGIVSVAVVRANDSGDNGNGESGNGNSGTNAAGIDSCVIGTWRVTSAKEKVELEGSLTEFSARGGTVELKGDGTGKSDYGSGVTYTGKVSDQNVSITFTGSVTYSFKTVDGSFTFSNIQPNGTATVKVNGVQTTSIPLDLDTKPSKYECNGDTMTQSTDLAITELGK